MRNRSRERLGTELGGTAVSCEESWWAGVGGVGVGRRNVAVPIRPHNGSQQTGTLDAKGARRQTPRCRIPRENYPGGGPMRAAAKGPRRMRPDTKGPRPMCADAIR